jgi:predicted acyltransferase
MDPIPTSPVQKRRVESIDAFRGLTILLMVFVIAVAAGDYRNLPQAGSWFGSLPVSTWNHADVGWERFEEAKKAEGMDAGVIRSLPEANLRNIGLTVTDLVAPFFVFIVGMAIPLSRGRRGTDWWRHVMSRTLMLIAAGVVYISLILGLSWWWGILQAIGVAYFMGAASLKLPPRWRWPAIGGVLLIHAVCSATIPWWLHFGESTRPFWTISHIDGDWARPLTIHCRPWASISYGAMTMIGVLLGETDAGGDRKKIIRHSLLFGAGCLAAGLAIHQAGLATGHVGLCFNKPDVTSSYALAASGFGAWTFLLLYLVIDVAGRSSWAYPLKEFGKNALLAYFLQIIMRLVFRALQIEPLFAGSPNDTLLRWAGLIDAEWWRGFLLDKTGYNGVLWGAIWTGCLWSIVVWCNKRNFYWKL